MKTQGGKQKTPAFILKSAERLSEESYSPFGLYGAIGK
jgi:hypothetical protein